MLELENDSDIVGAVEAIIERGRLDMSDPVERQLALWREVNDRIFEACKVMQDITYTARSNGGF